MGRKLEFDKNQALEKVMNSFWAKGYDATSMRDLAQHLGLHLGSVYNALGDKDKVFEDALHLNIQRHVLPHLEALTSSENPLSALDGFLNNVVGECVGKEDKPGCFLINSLLDINNINPNISQRLHDYLLQIEDAFVTTIEKAIACGHIPAEKCPRQWGRFIMSSLFMLRTMAKLGVSEDYIHDIKNCTIRGLTHG